MPHIWQKAWGIFFIFLSFIFLTGLGLHCCASGLLSSGVRGLLLAAASLCKACALERMGLKTCGSWAQQSNSGLRLQARGLCCTGLVAPRHVGPSQTRDQSHVPCIGRQTLNHRIAFLSFLLL